jgi:chemotaxis protein MotB
MAKGDKRNKGGNIIIKREEVVEGGHHGGAWKVAYADFVTAMMAFFLLMWLINATTEEQRKGLADYFSPTSVLSHTFSGSGQPFGGHTAFDEGQMASDRGAVQIIQGKVPVPTDADEDETADTPAQNRTYQRETTPQNPDADAQGASLRPPLKPAPDARPAGPTDEAGAPSSAAPRPPTPPRTAQGTGGVASGETSPGQMSQSQMSQGQTSQGQTSQAQSAAAQARQAAAQAAAEERKQFAAAAEQIKEAVRQDPALAELGRQLAIDITPEGLRIQIMDEIKLPMFATGSAAPNDRARMLLQRVVPVLNRLTEDISISGYTDAAPYPGPDRTNWELSTERANATRHLLTEDGLADSRIKSVTGHADRDPLLPEQPLAAANRRIAIMVLRRALPPRRAPTPAATMPSAPAPAPASAPAAAPAPAAAMPATPAATGAKPPPPAMPAPPAASGAIPAPPAFVAPPASAGPAPATAR